MLEPPSHNQNIYKMRLPLNVTSFISLYSTNNQVFLPVHVLRSKTSATSRELCSNIRQLYKNMTNIKPRLRNQIKQSNVSRSVSFIILWIDHKVQPSSPSGYALHTFLTIILCLLSWCSEIFLVIFVFQVLLVTCLDCLFGAVSGHSGSLGLRHGFSWYALVIPAWTKGDEK